MMIRKTSKDVHLIVNLLLFVYTKRMNQVKEQKGYTVKLGFFKRMS